MDLIKHVANNLDKMEVVSFISVRMYCNVYDTYDVNCTAYSKHIQSCHLTK